LESMRTRAEELGGSFEIARGPRGTRVYARLPL
jgi:signal transduction histidine kinase